VADYSAEFACQREMGLVLVNNVEQHLLASELEFWYPLICEMTPPTRIYDVLPSADEIESIFGWPIFVKGSRQTSKHNPDLSVVRSRMQYLDLTIRYQDDPILRWQKPAVRQFVELMPVAGDVPGKIRPSVEYRSFWWNGTCVGWGCYWYQLPSYKCSDIRLGLALAGTVAARLDVPFLVVDFAKAVDGRWLIIECNDGQESGYAGVSPQLLWRNVLDQLAA